MNSPKAARPGLEPVLAYLAYALLAQAAALAYLLAIPSDPRNQGLGGYSPARLLTAGLLGLLAALTAGLLVWAWRDRALRGRLAALLFSSPAAGLALAGAAFFCGLLAAFALTVQRILPLFPNRFLVERLQPPALLGLLLCAGLLPFSLGLQRRRPWQDARAWLGPRAAKFARRLDDLLAALDARLTPALAAGLAALAALPLLFQAALRFGYPTGSAGLFALMSELLRQNRFALPQDVPFYGPGGIPFAYPPLGFYLMALVEALTGISPLDYLRFAPPLFSALAVLALGLIAHALTGSRAAAVTAVIIAAASPRLFLTQVTAGGVVRGLAFALILWAVLAFLRAGQAQSWKTAAAAGALAGLAALTHLGYAQFGGLFFAACLLAAPFARRTWLHLLAAAAGALAVTLPWLLTVLARYGPGIFRGAFSSHGNSYFLLMLADAGRILPWVEDALRPVLQAPLLWGLIVLGLIIALLERKALPVLWFGLVLFFASESDRYLITIGALLAGMVTARLVNSFRAAPGQAAVFLLALCAVIYVDGWAAISRRFQPEIGPDSLALGQYVQAQAPAGAVYLAVIDHGEAEWLPYLLRRAPAAGSWGAEWLGTYSEQLAMVSRLGRCEIDDSPECLAQFLAGMPQPPDYLITLRGSQRINQSLAGGGSWQALYQNERYLLWQPGD